MKILCAYLALLALAFLMGCSTRYSSLPSTSHSVDAVTTGTTIPNPTPAPRQSPYPALVFANPAAPAPTIQKTAGWDPGLRFARASHYDGNGNPFWETCPSDKKGCPPLSVTNGSSPDPSIYGYVNDPALPGVNYQRYQADFDLGGNLTPCKPYNNLTSPSLEDKVTFNPNGPFGSYSPLQLICPFFTSWLGSPAASGAPGPGLAYAVAVDNYGWRNRFWNSENMWNGLEESAYTNGLRHLRLDNVLFTLDFQGKVDAAYVENGISARGQGRLLVGIAFKGADNNNYSIEINLSNMRANLTDHRVTGDCQPGTTAPDIPVGNPWRDDIWDEAIDQKTAYDGTKLFGYVIGARNWGFNLVEGQAHSITVDPWWIATSLLTPPSPCPAAIGSPDPANPYKDFYGTLCSALPRAAVYDANGNPAATLLSFYAGIEMGGTAVYGNAILANWNVGTKR